MSNIIEFPNTKGHGDAKRFADAVLQVALTSDPVTLETRALRTVLGMVKTISVHMSGRKGQLCQGENVLHAAQRIPYRVETYGDAMIRLVFDGDYWYDLRISSRVAHLADQATKCLQAEAQHNHALKAYHRAKTMSAIHNAMTPD